MRPETYTRANLSSNLAQDAAHHRPVDVLTAAGMAGMHGQLAHCLARCHMVGTPGDLDDARKAATQALLRVKRKRPATWPGMGADMAQRVAHAVLVYWRDSASACPHCSGRGYLVIPGTPTLSDAVCPSCHGQGRVDLSDAILEALGHHAVDPARWLYGEIDAIESTFLRRMGAALK